MIGAKLKYPELVKRSILTLLMLTGLLLGAGHLFRDVVAMITLDREVLTTEGQAWEWLNQEWENLEKHARADKEYATEALMNTFHTGTGILEYKEVRKEESQGKILYLHELAVLGTYPELLMKIHALESNYPDLFLVNLAITTNVKNWVSRPDKKNHYDGKVVAKITVLHYAV